MDKEHHKLSFSSFFFLPSYSFPLYFSHFSLFFFFFFFLENCCRKPLPSTLWFISPFPFPFSFPPLPSLRPFPPFLLLTSSLQCPPRDLPLLPFLIPLIILLLLLLLLLVLLIWGSPPPPLPLVLYFSFSFLYHFFQFFFLHIHTNTVAPEGNDLNGVLPTKKRGPVSDNEQNRQLNVCYYNLFLGTHFVYHPHIDFFLLFYPPR